MASAWGGEKILRTLHQGSHAPPLVEKTSPCSSATVLKSDCHGVANASSMDTTSVRRRIVSGAERKSNCRGSESKCRCLRVFRTEEPAGRPQSQMNGTLWISSKTPQSCRVENKCLAGSKSSVSPSSCDSLYSNFGAIGPSRGQRSSFRKYKRAVDSFKTKVLETDEQVSERDIDINAYSDDGNNGRSVRATNGLRFTEEDYKLGRTLTLEDTESLQEQEALVGLLSSEDTAKGGCPADDADDAVFNSSESRVTNPLEKVEDAGVILPAVTDNARATISAAKEQNAERNLVESSSGTDTGNERKAQLSGVSAGLVEACEPLITRVEQSGDRTEAGKILVRDLEVLGEIAVKAKTAIRETFRMRIWEDSSTAARVPSQTLPIDQGQKFVDADAAAINKYQRSAMDFFYEWKVPLRLPYDPNAVQGYFNRRPQVVVFRILEVAAAFSGVAFQLLLEKIGLSLDKRKRGDEEVEDFISRSSETLKQILIRLGPTFIKVAQSLSSRPDVIGTKTAKVLSELQDRLAPFPTEEATAIMEEELGVPINQVFKHLSSEPVAAASFGQVYRGWTVEGEEVAVKVQRPDLLFSVARDIFVLRLGLGFVRKLAKMNSDISVLADELGQGLFGELDYNTEAANSKEFGFLHKHLEFVKVPRILDHLTRARVLTMEWINGERPLDLQLIADGGYPVGAQFSLEQRLWAKQRLDSLVRKGVECSLVQLLETGFMHADPHPGNLLYTQENVLAYLDFGLTVRVQKRHRAAMLAVIAHLINGEWECLVNDFGDLEITKPSTDRFALRLALERAFGGNGPDAIVKNGKPDIQFSQLTGKLWKVALAFRFRLPAYYTLVLRSLVSLEGIAVSVDPNYKVFAAAYPYVIRRLLTDNSLATRMVLRSLVLTNKDEVRWDRISAILATSRKDALEKSGLSVNVTDGGQSGTHPGNRSRMASLVEFALSNEGAPLRRILLTAEPRSLGLAFVSPPARPLRRNVASALGETFFFNTLGFIGKKSWISGEADRFGNVASQTELNLTTEDSSSSRNSRRLTRGGPQPSAKSRTEWKRLLFLLKAVGGKLRRSPLTMLRVIWTVATILAFAVAVALQRLAFTLGTRLLSLTRRSSSVDDSHRERSVQAGTDASYSPL